MAHLIERHNPSPRQVRFREDYRSNIHPTYNGPLHIGVIYVVGIAVLSFCASQLQGAGWEWLLVVPVFFFSNLFEWWIHKNVMHRLVDVWALRAIYDRHTRQHHQYFTDNEMTVDSTREWRIIFFSVAGALHLQGAGHALRDRAWLAGQSQRGLHPDDHHRRPVSALRTVSLLLPRA